jgi:hypothetical protein
MQLAQIVRPWGFLLVLGLAGFLLGCSGQGTAPLEEQEKKKVMAERNAERKEAMKDMRKGRGLR